MTRGHKIRNKSQEASNMESAMLDRKMAIYTIQVCGWTANMGETNQRARDVTRGHKIRNKSQEASNMESAMLDRKMAIYSIPCSHTLKICALGGIDTPPSPDCRVVHHPDWTRPPAQAPPQGIPIFCILPSAPPPTPPFSFHSQIQLQPTLPAGFRDKSQEASNMESAMLDRKMAIYSIPDAPT